MPDGSTPVDSPAARDIIAKAKETPAGQKLHVFALGAFTNVASALRIDPGIRDKVAVYLMGYNYEGGKLTTDEFNAEGDPNAARSMLGSGVELYVMPASVVRGFRWPKAEVDAHFKGKDGIKEYLVRRWEAYAPTEAHRILWDVASFEAYLRPELATLGEVVRGGATIHVWTDIDGKGMQADYWAATEPR